jgi:hypothetical protein
MSSALKPAASAVLPLALLAGCASSFERSYGRWYDYRASLGPYTHWAGCIEERSQFYLDLERAPPGADFAKESRSQLFTRVLTDCRSLMTGPQWENLSAEQASRLIADAYQAFERVGAEIMDHNTRSVTAAGN